MGVGPHFNFHYILWIWVSFLLGYLHRATVCRKMQFHGCHSKANAVQFTSQHAFWMTCWYPKEPFVASTPSPYPFLHYSLSLLHCQWLGERENRRVSPPAMSTLSPFSPQRCQGLAQQLQVLPKCKRWDSGQPVVRTREVNSLFHLGRGNETKNSTAHSFSSSQANFHGNRAKKSLEKV